MRQEELIAKLEQLEKQANALQKNISELRKEIQTLPDKELIASEKPVSVFKDYKKEIRLDELATRLSDLHKTILIAVGRDGLSSLNDILEYVEKNTVCDRDQIILSVKELETESFNVIIDEMCFTPFSMNRTMHSLSSAGKALYKYLYGKEPVLSEAEQLRITHGSLKRAMFLKDISCILKTVGYRNITSSKDENTIKISNTESFIPSIIAETNYGKKTYWELELRDYSDTEFMKMLNAAERVTDILYIVTGGRERQLELKQLVKDWNQLAIKGSSDMTVCVLNMYELSHGLIFANGHYYLAFD